MADKTRIAQNTFYLSLAHGASKFFSILLTAVATRFLGPVGYGAYTAGNTFIEVARVIASSGLNYLVTREVADDPAHTTRVASAAAAVKVLLASVVYAGLALLVWRLDYPPPVLHVVLILGVIVFLENISDVADAVFQGAQRMDYITRTMLISSTSIFVFASGALFLGLGLEGFALGIALGCLVRMLVSTTLLRRHFGRISAQNVEGAEVRRMVRAAVPLMGATVLTLIFHRVDILMLSRMTNEASWGHYGVAVRVVDVVVLAPRILATAVYPQMRQAREAGAPTVVALMTTSTRVSLVICSGLALAVWTLAPLAVRVIAGPEFAPAVGALRILAWAIVLEAGCHMLVRLLFSADRERDLLPIGGLGIACNVTLNTVLIPRMGINGAALATLISYGVTLGLYYYYAARASYRVPIWRSAGGPLLSVALGAGVIGLLSGQGLLLRAAAGTATWILALAVLRVAKPSELEGALRLLRRR
jgi:O-antigen/teichoic acid export membrane protein